jgi:hypothetical protein
MPVLPLPAVTGVPYAKAALQDVIADALTGAAETDVTLTWGAPGDQLTRETIWLDDVTGATEFNVAAGNVSHRETYILPIVVYVLDEGNDAQRAEERCWQLAGILESAIRVNVELENAYGVVSALVSARRFASYLDPEGRIAEIVIDVTVSGRI